MTLDFSRTMWFVFASVIIISWLKHSIFNYMYTNWMKNLAYSQVASQPDNLVSFIPVPVFSHFPLTGDLEAEENLWTTVCSLVSNGCPYLQSIIEWVYIILNLMHSHTFTLPVICNKRLTNIFLSGCSKPEIQHSDINANLYFLSPWRS